MPNGSLENWLHVNGRHQASNLNLNKRLDIAIDVASALDYLHHHCETVVVHCDLKPSNILLDDDLIAHVGDFGLAKLLYDAFGNFGEGQISSVAIKGTIGYVAPEYGMGSEASTEGDVYSYGILLLEMITGKRPTDKMFKDGLSLHSFCKMTFPERVEELVDSCLLVEEINEVMTNKARNPTQLRGKRVECLLSIIQIGIACSAESPGERMKIQDVIKNLHQVKQLFLGV
ncbi:hypothetical protein F0562_013636 [Nyssa sinensis]|uniref:non-specific serine/threonine protein kinase n=1 Tax=Nyssa sinensis TaxID=561372 RepID=A0A5J4ZL83_9ASTE|nr:hypothetical protein F0562_013636 [Nyssa sinensis]